MRDSPPNDGGPRCVNTASRQEAPGPTDTCDASQFRESTQPRANRGAMLAEAVRRGGDRRAKSQAATLLPDGISKDQSSRWQELAQVGATLRDLVILAGLAALVVAAVAATGSGS